MLTRKVAIKIPTPPNFIHVGEQAVPISEFSEKELKAIGAEWTKELVKSAREKRSNKIENLTPTPRGLEGNA